MNETIFTPKTEFMSQAFRKRLRTVKENSSRTPLHIATKSKPANTIQMFTGTAIDTPQETLEEFEARRKENLTLLDCPHEKLTVEENMEYILSLFPKEKWPLQVSYW